MKLDLRRRQKQVCRNVGAHICDVHDGEIVGISRTALDGLQPLNGLRHPPTSGVSGWYLWGGTELSGAEDFFAPLHIGHLETQCKLCMPYLLLPPGWRFLTDGNYSDVWFDDSLLSVGLP